MEFKKMLITPFQAKGLLEANVKNRRVKQPVVKRYADDMANGKWKQDTGETIKISENGVILDGQHRLLAIVKSNVSLYFHVAYDVPDDSFDVIDTGSVRNASDAFVVYGIKNSNALPSMISMHHALKYDIPHGSQKNRKPTNSDILKMYLDHEEFWQNIGKKAMNWYEAFSKILQPSVIGSFFAFFSEINADASVEFMNQLCTGQDIKNNSIALLRQKLIQDKLSVRKMPPYLKYALIIKTWNYFRSGEKIKILKFDVERDNFPVAI
jgi:hypothetical protein